MCTVIIRVPDTDADTVKLLAVRDEDPARPWDRLGPWWPQAHPGVVGIRDARAGGAWLAASPTQHRVAVLLNRHDLSGRPDSAVHTRGTIALEAVSGRAPSGAPATRGFNLVDVSGHRARVVSWDGIDLRETVLTPGIHMIAHDDVDDPGTVRIARWLPEFREVGVSATPWWAPWLDVLARSAALPGDHPSAIIRRQEFEGIASNSLVIAAAEVGESFATVNDAPLDTAGKWNPVDLR